MKATLNKKGHLRMTYAGNQRVSDRLHSVLIWFDCNRGCKAIWIEINKSTKDYGCTIRVTNTDNISLEGNCRGKTESEVILKAFNSIGITFDRQLGLQDSGLRNYTSIKEIFEAIGLELGVERGALINEGMPIHNL
jgi:hypothetical protein